MIDLDVPRYLGQLKTITPELAREFRFPALFSFAGTKLKEAMAFAFSEWEDDKNPAPYQLVCLRTLRYLTVIETMRKRGPDFEFWARAFSANSDPIIRQECVLACYGSEDERAWDLVRMASTDRVGKVRAFGLQIVGSMVRMVPARRATGMAQLKYNLEHGNPWNRLGALMGYSIAGLRGDGLATQLIRFVEIEWDDTLRHMAIGLLSRIMEKEAFATFAADFMTRAAPLPAGTQAVLFHFLSLAHPNKAQAIAAQAFLDPKSAGPLAAAAAQGLAVQATVGSHAWKDDFSQTLLGLN
jgi:hypothetical protein